MSFAQIVQDYRAQTDLAPVLPAQTPAELPVIEAAKEITYHVAGVAHTISLPQPKLPRIPRALTSPEVKTYQEALKTHRQTLRTSFDALSAEDRRKLTALVRAGQTGGTVKSYYKVNLPFDSSAITATSAQLDAGLAAAQTEGLDLEGSWL